jgi:hypothetical protein
MARPLSWLVVAGLAGAALIGPGAGGVGAAGGPGSPDFVPNSGHTSSSGLTLSMNPATMSCTGGSVNSINGSFNFTGSGHVVVYLVPNGGSDADPVGNVENNEITVDLTGKSSPVAFDLVITSAFTTTHGGVLAVFASDVAGTNAYSSKSNSLNCTETTTTTTTDSTTTDSTTSETTDTTSTESTSTESTSTDSTSTESTTSETTDTTSTDETTSETTDTTTTDETTSETTDSTTSESTASTTSEQTEPSGEVEGVEGTPNVTLPPTSTLDAATPTGNPDGLRIVLLGLAVLLASILLLQPKGSRSRK